MVVTSAGILGVSVDCLDMAGTLAGVEALLAAEGPCRLVATVNPESIMRARRDPDFASALEGAALRVPDGWGAVWAARRAGCELERPVTGADLATELAGLCARTGRTVFLLGARPGVAEAAAAELGRRHPGLRVAGCHAGSPREEADAETVRLVAASGAKVLLVAYGQPAQELWIARNAGRLPARVAVGVGGTFDYLAGRVPRAPEWMRRRGLEWLYRLVRQPWRARRMAVLPLYALLVLTRRA